MSKKHLPGLLELLLYFRRLNRKNKKRLALDTPRQIRQRAKTLALMVARDAETKRLVNAG